jgi:ArsR family transcriptional regulator
MAQLFRILGDETRLRVLMTLRDAGEMNVTALCRKLRIPQPTVSHHLGILRMGGLVSSRRLGKEIHYAVGDLRRHRYTRAVKALLRDGAAVRIGPLLVGMEEG